MWKSQRAFGVKCAQSLHRWSKGSRDLCSMLMKVTVKWWSFHAPEVSSTENYKIWKLEDTRIRTEQAPPLHWNIPLDFRKSTAVKISHYSPYSQEQTVSFTPKKSCQCLSFAVNLKNRLPSWWGHHSFFVCFCFFRIHAIHMHSESLAAFSLVFVSLSG